MKGIILAGGSGTRLYPLTKSVSKQLLPIYDKPMIYYPLATLMLSGIKDVLIVTTPQDNALFIDLLGNGSDFGINIEFAIQEKPTGLPDAFIIGEKFIGDNNVCLILGDNIFHSDTFINKYLVPSFSSGSPTVFGCHVVDPERYGVVEFDKDQNVLSIEEKPPSPKSHYAVTGLYVFDKNAPSIAKNLQPSDRGETEIVDMLDYYLKHNNLKVELLGRGVSWLDTGTHKSLHEASSYIEVLENRQGLKIACLEEIAFQKGYISKDKLTNLAIAMKNNEYGQYLIKVLNEN
ncbi:glucose-1-phosphate thymidylyltransferase RfbA [Patescibacteria group bacterium]|nr:glucose-1-phosphate thymidylyltransferase RfbA [Patescibacteria group bacterium]